MVAASTAKNNGRDGIATGSGYILDSYASQNQVNFKARLGRMDSNHSIDSVVAGYFDAGPVDPTDVSLIVRNSAMTPGPGYAIPALGLLGPVVQDPDLIEPWGNFFGAP